jgi:hypothetical protein
LHNVPFRIPNAKLLAGAEGSGTVDRKHLDDHGIARGIGTVPTRQPNELRARRIVVHVASGVRERRVAIGGRRKGLYIDVCGILSPEDDRDLVGLEVPENEVVVPTSIQIRRRDHHGRKSRKPLFDLLVFLLAPFQDPKALTSASDQFNGIGVVASHQVARWN